MPTVGCPLLLRLRHYGRRWWVWVTPSVTPHALGGAVGQKLRRHSVNQRQRHWTTANGARQLLSLPAQRLACPCLQGAPAQTRVVADANFACREKQDGKSGVRNCVDSTCELRTGVCRGVASYDPCGSSGKTGVPCARRCSCSPATHSWLTRCVCCQTADGECIAVLYEGWLDVPSNGTYE